MLGKKRLSYCSIHRLRVVYRRKIDAQRLWWTFLSVPCIREENIHSQWSRRFRVCINGSIGRFCLCTFWEFSQTMGERERDQSSCLVKEKKTKKMDKTGFRLPYKIGNQRLIHMSTSLQSPISSRVSQIKLLGRWRGGGSEPTECRSPAERREAQPVFTSLMFGAKPQSTLFPEVKLSMWRCQYIHPCRIIPGMKQHLVFDFLFNNILNLLPCVCRRAVCSTRITILILMWIVLWPEGNSICF